MSDDYQEIVIVVVGGIIVLSVLTGIIIYVLFFYQRRRFQHKQQIIELQKQFNETLLTAQLEIQEHDFNIISQEIHDNVGQVLSLAKIQLNIISQSEHIERSMINEVKENLAKIMTDLRDIAKGLNTERVQVSNLHNIILQEVERINRSRFICGLVQLKGVEIELEQKKKLILFRIIQECLQNILKHSQATDFTILLNYFDSALEIAVADNGIGFETDEAISKKNGMGLSNIEVRTALIGGTTSITSKPKNGTTILIKIPYE